LLPSADQLRQPYRELQTEFIRDRIASGQLSDTALTIANEELQRRGAATEPMAPFATDAGDDHSDAVRDFLSEPFGWTWRMWLAVFVLCFLVVASFGVKARQQGDQAFLYGVIVVQAVALSGVIRTVVAVFRFSSFASTFVKLAAICALGVVLFGLTVCSELARHGWRGG